MAAANSNIHFHDYSHNYGQWSVNLCIVCCFIKITNTGTANEENIVHEFEYVLDVCAFDGNT